MTPTCQIIEGDALEKLRQLDAESIQCCVTSPPYWGLRDYQANGQLGLEKTPGEYVKNLVEIFREVRRVLRNDGTAWLNLGDSYYNYRPGGDGLNRSGLQKNTQSLPQSTLRRGTRQEGLKEKDLCGIPWRVAFALQQPYYTGKIKDERDRIWLAAAIDGEGCLYIHKRKQGQNNGQGYQRQSDSYSPGLEVANTNEDFIKKCLGIAGVGSICRQKKTRRLPLFRWTVRSNESRQIIREIYPHLISKLQQARILCGCPSSGKLASDAHQAMIDLHNGKLPATDFDVPPTMFESGWYLRSDVIWKKPNPMPESVIDRPTKSHEYIFLLTKQQDYFYDAEAIKERGTIPEGTLGAKGSPERFGANGVNSRPPEYKLYDGQRNKRSVWTVNTYPTPDAHFATYPPDLIKPCILAGSRTGDTILDCFAGSGTTGQVALELGRNCVLIELNPKYIHLCRFKTDITPGLPL